MDATVQQFNQWLLLQMTSGGCSERWLLVSSGFHVFDQLFYSAQRMPSENGDQWGDVGWEDVPRELCKVGWPLKGCQYCQRWDRRKGQEGGEHNCVDSSLDTGKELAYFPPESIPMVIVHHERVENLGS